METTGEGSGCPMHGEYSRGDQRTRKRMACRSRWGRGHVQDSRTRDPRPQSCPPSCSPQSALPQRGSSPLLVSSVPAQQGTGTGAALTHRASTPADSSEVQGADRPEPSTWSRLPVRTAWTSRKHSYTCFSFGAEHSPRCLLRRNLRALTSRRQGHDEQDSAGPTWGP